MKATVIALVLAVVVALMAGVALAWVDQEPARVCVKYDPYKPATINEGAFELHCAQWSAE